MTTDEVPARLSAAELSSARQAAFEAGASTSTDVLSDSARGERDKLLLVGLLCLLLLTTSDQTGFKVPGLDGWHPNDARLLPGGLLVALVYYLTSFFVLARTDFLRWRLSLPKAAAEVSKWNDRLGLHISSITAEMQQISGEMADRHAEGKKVRGALEARREAVEAVRRAHAFTSPEYRSADEEWMELSTEILMTFERYSNLELGAKSMSLNREYLEASGLVALLHQQVGRWRSFGFAHRAVSLVVPISFGAGVLLLMAWHLSTIW
jgi:hypothetical protein